MGEKRGEQASQQPREESVSHKRERSTAVNAAKVKTKIRLLCLAVWEMLVISVSGFSGIVIADKTERKRLKRLNNASKVFNAVPGTQYVQ